MGILNILLFVMFIISFIMTNIYVLIIIKYKNSFENKKDLINGFEKTWYHMVLKWSLISIFTGILFIISLLFNYNLI